MKAEQLDLLFDEGKEDILEYCDLSTAKRPALDKEAKRLRIESQSLIKVWIAQHLDCVNII